jgi:hypothetical protein
MKTAKKSRSAAVNRASTLHRTRGIINAERIVGKLLPEFDEDNVEFETAEIYANEGGQFGFPMFRDSQSRAQQYDRATDEALSKALQKIR